eukprot:GHVH01009284.1.p3 GENE.GHVH01009284.1~~GHVH01009284.1.p3  ORF type:complete len:151 (+),score=25.10 GHVH01009284.1:149-601(+)
MFSTDTATSTLHEGGSVVAKAKGTLNSDRPRVGWLSDKSEVWLDSSSSCVNTVGAPPGSSSVLYPLPRRPPSNIEEVEDEALYSDVAQESDGQEERKDSNGMIHILADAACLLTVSPTWGAATLFGLSLYRASQVCPWIQLTLSSLVIAL